MELIRTFLAIPCDADLRARLTACAADWIPRIDAAGLRWVSQQNYHLTLAFIGVTQPRDVQRIADALLKPVRALAPFDYAFDRLDWFPSLERAKVIAALPADPAPFAHWQRRVTRVLRDLGIPHDAQRFTPHLTMARTRGPGRARTPLDAPIACAGRADAVVLYRSHAGAYEALATMPCGEAAT